MIELLKSKNIYIIFFLYAFSNLFFLLNPHGVYWDGWCVYNQDDSTLKLLFKQIQHGVKGDFFLLLSHIGNGLYSFRIFTFVATFIMGIFVYLILKNIKEFNQQTIFFITLIFLLVPVNSAKISISVIPFIFPVLIFYIAFYILTLYLKKPFFLSRYLVLSLFFISFSTNSILVFYFCIFLYIYYHEFGLQYNKIFNKSRIIIIKYWDFILLPFIYFIYKAIYLKPYGLYAGYNNLSILNLFDSIKIIFFNFDNSFIRVILTSIYSLSFFSIFVLVILYLIAKKSKLIKTTEEYRIFFFIGIVLFLLAVFPYAMVGKNAELDSWNSRFQILTPLGLSFMIFFGLSYLKQLSNFNERTFVFLLWFILFAFIGQNISTQYYQLKDYFYSVAIEKNIQNNEKIRQHTTYIINNSITDSLFYNRTPIYYEINGLFRQAFGHDSKLGMRYDHYIKGIKQMSDHKHHKQYNYSSWERENPLLITISHNYEAQFGQDYYLNMIFYNLYDHEKFLDMAKQLVHISVEDLPKETNER